MVVRALGHVRRLVGEKLQLDGKPGVLVPVISPTSTTLRGVKHDQISATFVGLGHSEKLATQEQVAELLRSIRKQVARENPTVHVELSGSIKTSQNGNAVVPETFSNPDRLPVIEIRAKFRYLQNPTITPREVSQAQGRFRVPQ